MAQCPVSPTVSPVLIPDTGPTLSNSSSEDDKQLTLITTYYNNTGGVLYMRDCTPIENGSYFHTSTLVTTNGNRYSLYTSETYTQVIDEKNVTFWYPHPLEPVSYTLILQTKCTSYEYPGIGPNEEAMLTMLDVGNCAYLVRLDEVSQDKSPPPPEILV